MARRQPAPLSRTDCRVPITWESRLGNRQYRYTLALFLYRSRYLLSCTGVKPTSLREVAELSWSS